MSKADKKNFNDVRQAIAAAQNALMNLALETLPVGVQRGYVAACASEIAGFMPNIGLIEKEHEDRS